MSTPAADIMRLMQVMGIGCVLDIGANAGQFGEALIHHGFGGRLISFEPLSESFKALRETSRRHPDWHCRPLAIGAENGEATIYISENRVSSSILQAKPWSIEEHAAIAVSSREDVTVRRLDAIWDELPFPEPRPPIMVKIDVQGFEPQVIAGLGTCIDRVDLLLLEASLIPVYDGESPIEIIIADMRRRGLHPVWIGPGWGSETTGQIFQCDIAFAHQPVVKGFPGAAGAR